jgi:hypothetical protein
MNGTMKRSQAALGLAAVLVALWGAGCSSCAKGRQEGVKTMDNEWAEAALKTAETTGKLDGLEIEHYVGGGLPPPYYRSEQLRLLVQEGRDVLRFVTPNYDPALRKGNTYPRDTYVLPATPDDVKLVARLLRETGALRAPVPSATEPKVADALRTEWVISAHGKETKRVYPRGEPPELAKLTAVVETLIARVKAQGTHRVEP